MAQATVLGPRGAAAGAFAGVIAGGWAIATSVARKYHFLNPQHAAIWAVSNAIGTLVVHQGFKLYYGRNYTYGTPRPLQVVVSLSVSTLITGAVANALGVQLLFSAALKIMFGAAVAGALGWVIGRGCSGSAANEPAFVAVASDTAVVDEPANIVSGETGGKKPAPSAPPLLDDSAGAAAAAAAVVSGDGYGSDHASS